MTKKELIKALSVYPDDSVITVWNPRDDDPTDSVEIGLTEDGKIYIASN